MNAEPASGRIRLRDGDLTRLAVDAVVNAANQTLLGGGGVDGAIHAAAGPELREACARLPEVSPGVRCPTGEARITPGFRLPARFVIHTVGPVWRGGGSGEADLLAGCYRNALELAREYDLRTIAFPAISCGAFGYPAPEAAAVSVRAITAFLARNPELETVHLVARTRAVHAAWQAALERSRA